MAATIGRLPCEHGRAREKNEREGKKDDKRDSRVSE
jgi:hypothetical protein